VKVSQKIKQQRKARKRRLKIARQKIAERKRTVEDRIKHKAEERDQPMFRARNIQFEVADRTRAICYGGIGLIHSLARQCGLTDALDRHVQLLKVHFPYHESDHVLNIAYNALCDGKCLEDLERRRRDEAYLDALEATRIPDPTTAGDFCRRFKTTEHIDSLQQAIADARLNVWSRQPDDFFEQATVDMDGSIVPTTGECKQGMDISYNGVWGYHPLLLSLRQTHEVLRIVNRSGNRPSHEGAAAQCDAVIAELRTAGFRRILLCGDTDYSQTEHLDRWDQDSVQFHFGYAAYTNLDKLADELKESQWQPLKRSPRYQVKTQPRSKPDRVKEQIVVEREYKNIVLRSEEVAEFAYRPTACHKTYRMVVVRKNLSVEKGENVLFDKIVYFFYITNDRESTAQEVVFSCNKRCNQENVIEQLKNGPRAFRAPLDNLYSNWAYMLMASLAWTLKAWSALWLPETGRWKDRRRAEKFRLLRMEFRTFVNTLIRVPCQIVKTGRRLVYRVLGWNDSQPVFWRLAEVLEL
jgi:hypothetical protein